MKVTLYNKKEIEGPNAAWIVGCMAAGCHAEGDYKTGVTQRLFEMFGEKLYYANDLDFIRELRRIGIITNIKTI